MNSGLIDMRPAGAWRTSLERLVNSIGKDEIVMVEIGVYRGQSTECFLNSGKVSKIYCIDPWKNGYDDSDAASKTDMTLVESDFDNRVGSDERVSKIKGVLEDHLDYFNDKLIDFVYIDGNHQYDFVKMDILNSIRYLKPKVAIAGHDYQYPQVRKAVHEIFGKPDMTFADNSWIKFVNDEIFKKYEK